MSTYQLPGVASQRQRWLLSIAVTLAENTQINTFCATQVDVTSRSWFNGALPTDIDNDAVLKMAILIQYIRNHTQAEALVSDLLRFVDYSIRDLDTFNELIHFYLKHFEIIITYVEGGGVHRLLRPIVRRVYQCVEQGCGYRDTTQDVSVTKQTVFDDDGRNLQLHLEHWCGTRTGTYCKQHGTALVIGSTCMIPVPSQHLFVPFDQMNGASVSFSWKTKYKIDRLYDSPDVEYYKVSTVVTPRTIYAHYKTVQVSDTDVYTSVTCYDLQEKGDKKEIAIIKNDSIHVERNCLLIVLERCAPPPPPAASHNSTSVEVEDDDSDSDE